MAASKREGIALLPAYGSLYFLMPEQIAFGILEDLQPAEDGLIQVKLSWTCLVDEECQATLEALRGKFVSIVHMDGKWSAKEGFSKEASA